MAETNDGKAEFHDILDFMKTERIFSIEFCDDMDHVFIREECDGWYFARLDKREMQMLISNMQSICNKLK